MVAHFLLEECRRREIRPSVRLFVDKAIPDYSLWESGRTETHWRDLVVSELEQQLVEIQHPQRDLRRAEQTEAERRIVLDIFMSYPSRKERIEQWQRITAARFGQAKFSACLLSTFEGVEGGRKAVRGQRRLSTVIHTPRSNCTSRGPVWRSTWLSRRTIRFA